MKDLMIAFLVSFFVSGLASAGEYSFNGPDADTTCTNEITAVFVAFDTVHKNSEKMYNSVVSAHQNGVSKCPLSVEVVVGTGRGLFESGRNPANQNLVDKYRAMIKQGN
ncbi:hypothetical protein [Mariprofundus ferrooxydans]|nr:hypothetical protein [Mariprofundus ferrooxydans]